MQAAEAVYSKLYLQYPAYKLVYVCPEKVMQSPKFMSVLEHLYKRGKLSRIVIDEAHCVSQVSLSSELNCVTVGNRTLVRM